MPCIDAVEPPPSDGNGEPVETPQLFVIDASAEQVVGSGRKVIFTVAAAPANQSSNITFSYATSNGTATAGTHYTSKSGTGTIEVGVASVDIEVTVLEPSITGTKTFTMTISAPVNASIADATATGTIVYDSTGGGGQDGVPDWEKASYSSVAATYVPVYDQFRSYNNVTGPDHNDPDCTTADSAGCTGYAAALMMSILEYKYRHNAKVGFRARKILTDSGFTVGGTTWYDYYVHDQLTVGRGGNPAGALTCDGVRRTLAGIYEINDDASLGSTSARWADLKKRIKKRIVQNGCVYLSSSFYAGYWDTSGVEPYLYLRKPGSWGTSSGHSWILVGWNDNVTVNGRNIGGAFRVQSSHGKAWGDGGRAWIPYSMIVESYPGGSAKRYRSGPVNNFSPGTWGNGRGHPWFRFFYPVR